MFGVFIRAALAIPIGAILVWIYRYLNEIVVDLLEPFADGWETGQQIIWYLEATAEGLPWVILVGIAVFTLAEAARRRNTGVRV